jgi:hypothetical protein
MRRFVTVLLLGGTVSLFGCGSTPVDPYSNMRMLTSEELGVANQNQDPVQQAEKSHNAQFGKTKATP